MKYIIQFCIIMLFTLAGDVCSALLPFPIPASIYGMVLMLLVFVLKILKVEAVRETGTFLVSLLPLLFVVPTVELMACWELIRNDIAAIAVIILVSTVLTFGISGMLTKLTCKDGGQHD